MENEAQLDASASFTEEVTVVLKNDPRVLPMVCGICGSQFSTGRGLEVHLRTHKIDRRKKPSSEKKPVVSRSRGPSANEITTLSKGGSTVDESGLRKSMRTPKRKTADEQYLYIYEVDADGELLSEEALAASNGSVHPAGGEEEEAGCVQGDTDWGPRGGNGSSTRPRGDDTRRTGVPVLLRQPPGSLAAVGQRSMLMLPEFTKDGIPIARLDDYLKVEAHDDALHLIDARSQRNSLIQHTIVTSLQKPGSTEQASGGADLSQPRSVVRETMSGAAAGKLPDESLQSDEISAANSSELPLAGEAAEIEEMVFGSQQDISAEETEVMNESGQSTSAQMQKACEVCLKVLSSGEMREHMLTVHIEQNDFTCPYEGCGEAFTAIAGLRSHIVIHGIGAAACDICDQILPDASSLRAHMRLVHSGNKALVGSGTMEEDEEEPGVSSGEQACEYCNKVFKNRRAHSSHMKKHTKPLEPSQCGRCGRTFRHKTALKFHQKMNTDCDKSKYVCDICGYKGTSPWRLASHRNQVHSNERPFQCEMCPKTFKTREMMKLHMHKMHTGVPQLDCTVCGRKFFYKAELREHMQIHSDVKSFECSICHRAFKTMHVLRGHLSGKHSDTWYTCCFCKFTTSHKKSMKRHMVLVHKLADVTLEVKPEERAIQVEMIPSGEGDVQLHIPDGQIQYDDQLEGIVTTTVISEDGGTVNGSGIDTAAGECIVTTTMGNSACNPAVEVSEVLVALSSISEQCGPGPAPVH